MAESNALATVKDLLSQLTAAIDALGGEESGEAEQPATDQTEAPAPSVKVAPPSWRNKARGKSGSK